MPIVQNPAIAQGITNLSKMFAPPSGAEAAGWALANERNEKAKREAESYARMTAEGASPSIIDQFGIASGAFTPSQSYRAVDVESADRRYGTDRSFEASRLNNTADNARAIATNAATVAGDVQKQRLQSLAGWYGPIAQDAVRPAVPSEIAALYGAPGALPVAQGNRSPMSETEVKGAERQDLRARGLLTDDDMLDAIIGDRAPVEAIGPDGRPRYMSPGAAVRTGAQPAPRSPLVNVNTGPGGDGKLREKLDEAEGKRWSDLQGAATTASGLQQDLGLLGELIDQAPQGPIVGRLAEYFPEATTAGAAFQSIISRAAPGLRVEGSGATSDIEYNGMVRSLPRLRNDPEANRLIVGMMKAKADVNVRRGEIVNAYQNGRIDAAQARDQLGALNRQSILSPGLRAMIERAGGNEAPSAAPAATPSPGSIVDGFRFRGGDPSSPDSWEQL
ncbi:hypothetical protein [Aureimonas psammosilenae]|uniref:hypothetical protein n=1 Tax=Aureimonas psammosilenae TaxID=2495496 RepID=UPI0012609249|nr:hypothetical protein [Aureimonas psammosilenae]